VQNPGLRARRVVAEDLGGADTSEDLAADVAQFNRVMAGEIDGYSIEKRFIRKEGQLVDTTISAKALRRTDGQ